MTDAPTKTYDESFPALDGLNNNNNNNHSTNTPQSASLTIAASTLESPQANAASILANSNVTPTTNSWSTHSQAFGQQHQQPNQHQQTKLNYLNYQHIQHLYQQKQQQEQQQQHQVQNHQTNNTQQQQVLNHLVDPKTNTDNNSSASVTQYHNLPQQQQQQPLQQQQQQKPQQQQQQNQSNSSNIIGNINQHPNLNIISNTSRASINTMQANAIQQQQHRRPGFLNPLASERCCTFRIAPEERRHRNFDSEQSTILKEIMQKTYTKIEVTTTKDGALNFCIIGKESNLATAKNLVLNDFQTQVTLTVTVPKSIHGRLLGQRGLRLATIQDETQTKITIPRKDEDSDIIKIVGLKNNAEEAVRSIEKCAREFTSKSNEKVTVERNYLLFITGAFNENLKRWEEMGAKVSTSGGILPSNSDRESGHADEVTFTIIGETSAVQQVKDEIIYIYGDKKKKCTTVNIEVKKAQHKYILGPSGHNLRNLFARTGVSVELPHESESETITLRGERSKLATALSELYTQAHSETDEFFEVETWLHKYLIGPRKTNFIDFKALGVDVKSLDDKIKLHGPPTEVENIIDIFETELKTIRNTIIRKDIRVEPRIHGFIIGRSGATVDQIREESGAHVLVPQASEFITLEGTVEATNIAEEKINAIAKKYEASRKLVIDQQLHGSIIGRGGEKIRSIREKFSQVMFAFPEQGSKHNEITIVGPAEEVDECYKYLDEFHKQLQEKNHQVQVPIRSDAIKYLADAQGAIKRIKMDNRVKIDLFYNDGAKTEGGQGKGNKSKQQQQQSQQSNNVQQQQAEQANSNEASNAEGKKKSGKGKNKQPQEKHSNGVQEKAGPNAADKTNTSGDKKISENYALVTGKKEDVDQAKTKLSKLFDELATTTEVEVKIPAKMRSHLGPKSKLYRQFLDEFQQKVVVVLPSRQQVEESKQIGAGGSDASVDSTPAETNGVTNAEPPASKAGKKNKASKEDSNNNKNEVSNKERFEIVKIRGPKNIAKKAEKRFETLVSECQDKIDKNHSANVSVVTAVIDKFLYSDKAILNKIRDTQNVKLNIPDRRDNPTVNCSIIGYEKSVQTALQQFNKLIQDVSERAEETIEIPSLVHPRLIGAQGRAVKKFMEDFKVAVKFARQGSANQNEVTLSGRPECISAAKSHMLKLADQYLASASRANQQSNGNEPNSNNSINNNTNYSSSNNSNTINQQHAASNNSNNNSNNSHQQQPQAIRDGA